MNFAIWDVLIDATIIFYGGIICTRAIVILPQCLWSDPEGYAELDYRNVERDNNVTAVEQRTTTPYHILIGNFSYTSDS